MGMMLTMPGDYLANLPDAVRATIHRFRRRNGTV